MGKMVRRAALVLMFGLITSVFTFAQGGWRDMRHDRRDIHRDRVDLRHDYAELRQDRLSHNWQAARRERADIYRDRADLRRDHRDLRQDRRQYYRGNNGWWRDRDDRWHRNW